MRKKDRPFSNGTEFMVWHDNNCSRCKCYDPIGSDRSKSKCKYNFDLELASVSDGEVDINTLNMLGYKDGQMPVKCAIFDVCFVKVKFDRSSINQLNLF